MKPGIVGFILLGFMAAGCGKSGDGKSGGVKPLDNVTVCSVPQSEQVSIWQCGWSRGSALCLTQSLLEGGNTFNGLSCCVDDLAGQVTTRSAALDLSSDLPEFSFLKWFSIPAFLGDIKRAVTYVQLVGVSASDLQLSLWQEVEKGSCSLARKPADTFSANNQNLVDPVVQAVRQSYFGAFFDSGKKEIRSARVDISQSAQAWDDSSVVKTACTPKSLRACATSEDATFRAFLAGCGELTVFRTSDGKAFEEVKIPFSDFPSIDLENSTTSCLTQGEDFYLVWSVTKEGKQTYFFNQLVDGAGAWDQEGFEPSPQILSVDLDGPTDSLMLGKFWAQDGKYWASLDERNRTGEVQTGSVVYFGRSDNGRNWIFGQDTCTGRCRIPDFVVFNDRYFYLKSAATSSIRYKAEFYYNVTDGDPASPIRAGFEVSDLTSNSEIVSPLYHQAGTIGFLYWKNWDPDKPLGPALTLQRFSVED